MRSTSLTGTLARKGFQDAAAAASRIVEWQVSPAERDLLLQLAVESVDPDQAVDGLDRLARDQPTLLPTVAAERLWAEQLVDVLAASATLQQHLSAHPEQVEILRTEAVRLSATDLRARLLRSVGADPEAEIPVAGHDHSDELRLSYRAELLRIVARDLAAGDPCAVLEDVSQELAELADATIEAALALARHELGPDSTRVRLAVIALGKCGARELNYVSDVDVLHVAEPAPATDDQPELGADRVIEIATRLASGMSRICSAHSAAGTIWQVDAALRPEGKAGPLVRTLASHTHYYEKWAKNWEFQAMLKARPMAGDLDLARDFVEMIQPRVWRVAEQDNFVGEVQAMRRRVLRNIPAKETGRELKLGEGGLRDVEFTVQLLQLVHGRTDERLRTSSTFAGLQALVDHGYVGRSDGAEMAEAYRFIRVLEHRAQLHRLRRTHLLPTAEADLRRIGRALGLKPDQVPEGWRHRSRRVLALHRRLFYSPLLETVAKIPSGEVRLTTDAARDRLAALGYADPKSALGHIKALSQGMTRQAEIQRQLLPAMLGWFAAGPNPDQGLLAFRQVSEALGSTSWYLRGLRDEGAMAKRLARILSSSRYLVDLLTRNPEILQMLADEAELAPRGRAELTREMQLIADRQRDPIKAIDAVRGVRRRELFRIGVGDVLGVNDLETVGDGLSDLASATISVGLSIAARGRQAPPMAVVAMGRWGGHELSYSSDADAMFVVGADGEDAARAGTAVVSELRTLLSRPGREPRLEIDADLRPEGKGGPMVRTLGSYTTYYQRWSSTWEAQALVRADRGAGDDELTEALLAAVAGLRWPEGGLSRSQLAEIRRLKARMEGERLPRGADPKRHLKLGPGGLSDVEWTVQVLQLQHAGEHDRLRTTRTLAALHAARELELIDTEDAMALATAWTMASRIRDRIMLVRAKASDSLPHDPRELAAVAELMGYATGESSHLVADWMRVARQARSVVDRIFWDS
ncbi:bifunctional glutamine-synthetase adenylyltransferase/deadenyltransferase [Enemella dayhoffiae]|uniref:Bifunctional glutamine synthetase adenylyltransferase/adenylyl-removing enzyme n=1 Tax=Enemella dayhoffiae TaxID=2016507 RepID=A0A255H1F7_9ACTN|nr:bifunctional [glutamine synthetase] adenylyltransferase/[glutamine synthetase]-adenylyl-L-tyrosine phosphorylase [Enemella dayhoffiae]OYO21510.1 bifunctional glutamine-synthetase adenylyltransferase/deadenyltransferase [Enemella dayhoffiae]